MKPPDHPAPSSLNLPPIPDPKRYDGLYIYDFGTHVSVGYTAAEISMLRESETHRHGHAYEIYRVDERGGLELKGTSERHWSARQAMCFLRKNSAAAQQDYDLLRVAAEQFPLPCETELQLIRIDAFDPPHATALSYPTSAVTAVAKWLGQHAATVGDRVVGGADVHSTLAGSHDSRIESCQLPVQASHRDRTREEVLRCVNEPLQR